MSRPYTRFVQAAAFFDLDRTLLRRSSALALAGAFREHGVIGRGQLAKAAAWQLLFAARGASAETVRKAAEDGLMILKGFAVDDLRALVAGAMEPVLKPLVYQEALELVAAPPRARRAGLHRLGDAAGDRRGARAGARLRRRDRLDLRDRGRRLHRALAARRARRGEGGGRPRARRASTASTSTASTAYTRQPHRPAVPRGGRATPSSSTPTASCGGSRRSATGPCSSSASSPIRRCGGSARRCSGSRSCSAPARPSGRRGAVRPEPDSGSRRSASPRPTPPRSRRTSSTPSRAASSATGSRGSTGSRRCPICEPDAQPAAAARRAPATSAGTATARSAT